NNSFNFGNGSTYQYPITVTLGATQNTWVHIAFVLDTVNNKLIQYVNGVLVDNISTIYDPSPLNTSEFRAGRGSFSDSYAPEFNGQIDDMRVYSRALTADEAASLASGDNDN
ncbi:MAG: LamG domain-containing protein, partial [Candidatus Magasanikbacteria bacterium]|nr:LamG domain-containing protein [Candidatus Magasanikbacteria bacterium]